MRPLESLLCVRLFVNHSCSTRCELFSQQRSMRSVLAVHLRYLETIASAVDGHCGHSPGEDDCALGHGYITIPRNSGRVYHPYEHREVRCPRELQHITCSSGRSRLVSRFRPPAAWHALRLPFQESAYLVGAIPRIAGVILKAIIVGVILLGFRTRDDHTGDRRVKVVQNARGGYSCVPRCLLPSHQHQRCVHQWDKKFGVIDRQ